MTCISTHHKNIIVCVTQQDQKSHLVLMEPHNGVATLSKLQIKEIQIEIIPYRKTFNRQLHIVIFSSFVYFGFSYKTISCHVGWQSYYFGNVVLDCPIYNFKFMIIYQLLFSTLALLYNLSLFLVHKLHQMDKETQNSSFPSVL